MRCLSARQAGTAIFWCWFCVALAQGPSSVVDFFGVYDEVLGLFLVLLASVFPLDLALV